ncbi:MAG: hypothetical protein Q9200_003595 [Gallowayella weberi]
MVEILPPIESMPLDMPEATFARVRFLGNEYWITSDPGEDTVMVGGEYVVVEKSESVKDFLSICLHRLNYRPHSSLRPPLVPPKEHSHHQDTQISQSSPVHLPKAKTHRDDHPIRIHERNEIGIPEPLLALCKWFNSVTRQAAMKESTVWKAHVDRVRWLKWYWEQTSPGLVNRFRELQEEAKQLIVFREKERKEREKEREERFKSLEARIADAMDIDVDEGVQDDDAEWQDRHDGVDGDDGKEWYERTVNAAGEDDPEGLTQEQWEIVEEIEATFGAEELVSAADVAVDRKLGDVIHQSWIHRGYYTSDPEQIVHDLPRQATIPIEHCAPNQPWTQLPPPSKIQRCFQVPNTTGSLQSPMQYAFQAPLSPSSFQRPVNNRKAKPRTLSPRAVLSFRPEHYSEREMPRNENDVTMSKVLDRVIVPQYLSSNPACDDLGLACKIRYISRMRFRHAKLTVRVEKWRQGIPYELDDEKISLERIQNAISRGAARRPFGMQWLNLMKRREARERTNMTDYVNGEIDGLGRGRLMCWPVLIPIEAMDGWPLAEFDEDAAAELDKELEGFPSDF